eukprot:4289473-Alexandrium_andersonii.AAC.1
MLEPECMRTLLLGLVQWANGNALLWPIELGYFGHAAGSRKDALDRRLRAAVACFRQWATARGEGHSER